MTKVPVNVPGFSPNMSYKANKVQDTDTKGDFSKIFESQKKVNVEEKVQDTTSSEEISESQDDIQSNIKNESISNTTETKATDTMEKTTETQSGQNAANEETSEDELTEEELSAILPMLLNATDDIKNLLMQELGISKEELNVLMENMGLTEMDLLEQSNLKELVLQAKGITDMTALLTDEELYTQMQNLDAGFTEVMENVQETLQLTDEEMSVLKQQVSEVTNAEASTAVEMNQPAEGVEEQKEPKQQEHHAAQNGNGAENPNPAFAVVNHNNVNVQQNIVEHTQMAHATSFAAVAENEQIMQQVVDYMKIQLSADTNTLEMQLHPESLGSLHIRILEKEGVMTAQFTTTSETVRAALEGQMIQLLQQFDDQNIKVEAIEVAVSTQQQFDSAMMQSEDGQQTQSDKKGRARRINLNNLNGLGENEEYSEEDRVVVEMMAANGNTVDYLV